MNDQESMDRLIARIDQLAHLPDGEHSVDWAGASSQAALTALEQALGVRISGSFRTFILKTGGGGLDSLCISTIPASEPLGGLGSVHGDTLHYREGWAAPLPAHLVVIQRSQDDNEPFCLDTSRVQDGENPVVLFYHQSTGRAEPIAGSFIAFLEDYMEPYWEELSE
ncbi:SMI1/KNR4 family protein [Acidovorax sp.]|uniref:SMI1/KNR4 family protein n=1 Tax=Acidovorax sp. TaxID=1872122 RepID=UPI002ACDEB99|nr:SMI1/KNR4 family protein [Acidovorax sp.]MDZ7867071.1 SMI1/KNR4 family protein [Acidovorax sp.]